MKKQDSWHKWVFIGFYSLIFLIVVLNGTFGAGSGDGVDQPFLADRFDWGVFDIIGTLVFAAGLIWIAGFAGKVADKAGKPDPYGYGTKKQEAGNVVIGYVLPIVGLLMIWFL